MSRGHGQSNQAIPLENPGDPQVGQGKIKHVGSGRAQATMAHCFPVVGVGGQMDWNSQPKEEPAAGNRPKNGRASERVGKM